MELVEQSDAPPFSSNDTDTPDKAPLFELLVPPGWQKKIASLKKGGRKDVFFVSPDGEEIKSKRLLDRYLKSHPGGPAASEFDWSTGETPTRRSSRLSSKVRPSLDSPEGGSSSKRPRRKAEKDEEMLEPEQVNSSTVTKTDEKRSEPEEEIPSSATKADEEMLDREEIPCSVPKTDEDMEYVGKKEEVKTAQDTTVPCSFEAGDSKEVEPEKNRIPEDTCKASEEVTTLVGAQEEEEEKKKVEEVQMPCEEKSAGEKCQVSQVGEANALDGGSEGAKKTSGEFQKYPEAQNLSMPVGVST